MSLEGPLYVGSGEWHVYQVVAGVYAQTHLLIVSKT